MVIGFSNYGKVKGFQGCWLWCETFYGVLVVMGRGTYKVSLG